MVSLQEQDRTLWDASLIEEGEALVVSALSSGRTGAYTLQTAISAAHATAPHVQETDWEEIVGLYDVLLDVLSRYRHRRETRTMKHLCLVYGNKTTLLAHADSPSDSECHAYDVQLGESDRRIAAEALAPVSMATTVRVRRGETHVVDGPFAETKEQLLGFCLIEVRDLNEAIRIAAGIPVARIGSVEVRPVRELEIVPNTSGQTSVLTEEPS